MMFKLICGLTGIGDLKKLEEYLNTKFEEGYNPINISSGNKNNFHEICLILRRYK